MFNHRKGGPENKTNRNKTKYQQSTSSMGLTGPNSPDTMLRIGHTLVDKEPEGANAKSECLPPCVQSDNWSSAICSVIVSSVLLPMLRGSRQLEVWSWSALIRMHR